ncbi:MAG: hypothetical protein ACOVS5_15525, partial [Oligoflexus sp.]
MADLKKNLLNARSKVPVATRQAIWDETEVNISRFARRCGGDPEAQQKAKEFADFLIRSHVRVRSLRTSSAEHSDDLLKKIQNISEALDPIEHSWFRVRDLNYSKPWMTDGTPEKWLRENFEVLEDADGADQKSTTLLQYDDGAKTVSGFLELFKKVAATAPFSTAGKGYNAKLIKFCLERDLVVPLRVLVAEPHQQYEAGDAVVAPMHGEIGRTFIGWADGQFGTDIQRKMVFYHFNLYLK